ncbi:MAG TPA: caspase family protein, partial [Bryobacteraceae bacterium]
KNGVLFLSASQDYQVAAELRTPEMGAHGAFTWALLNVLGTSTPEESAEHLFQRTRALMQSRVTAQEPVMLATPERARLGLFGQPAAAFLPSTAAAASVDKVKGTIAINAGRAMNLYPGSEMKRVRPAGGPPVTIRIASIEGLASSTAVVKDGSADAVHPGDLFQLDRWVAPDRDTLRVYVGPTLALAQVNAAARAFGGLRGRREVEWVDDPATSEPTHVIAWDGAKWTIRGEDKAAALEGASADAVVRMLAGAKGRPRVFVMLPAASEIASQLRIGAGSPNPAIAVTPDSTAAHYLLMGRAGASGDVQYAWVLPPSPGGAPDPRPRSTKWLDTRGSAEGLTEAALRLGRVVGWLELQPPGFASEFPYELALQNTTTGKVLTAGEVTGGVNYKLVLRPKPNANWKGGSRRVYVFVVDNSGAGQLLFPSGNLQNEFPPPDAAPDRTLPLTGEPFDLTVSEPYGTDSYFLLTAEKPLDNPEALFNFEGVQGPAASRGAGDPLGRLLSLTGTGARSAKPATPVNWSVQRTFFKSVAPGK